MAAAAVAVGSDERDATESSEVVSDTSSGRIAVVPARDLLARAVARQMLRTGLPSLDAALGGGFFGEMVTEVRCVIQLVRMVVQHFICQPVIAAHRWPARQLRARRSW